MTTQECAVALLRSGESTLIQGVTWSVTYTTLSEGIGEKTPFASDISDAISVCYKEKTNLLFVFCNCVPLGVDVLLHLCLCCFVTLDLDLSLLNQVIF